MKPPERVVFFIDRSLGKYDVATALRGSGYECEIHDDHFSQATEDEEWLRRLSAKKWVVLTKDERIRYRPLELRALRESRLRVFVAVCGNVTGAESGRIILQAMPRILHLLRSHGPGPLIGYIYKNGTVRVA